MTEAELFNKFFSGGNFSLPYLIYFYHPKTGNIYIVNNNDGVSFRGNEYKPSSFDYNPPDTSGKGATLKVTGIDNPLIEFAEDADYQYRLEVVGVITESGMIQQIKSYTHFYGTVSYGDDMQMQFQLGRDDRLDMTFCPYTYDTDNNRANA